MTDINSDQAQWNSRYESEEYFYGTSPNDFLRQNFGSIPRGKVLCLADGEGRNSVFLAQMGYEVSSVDISTVGVEKTRRLAAERGVAVNATVGDLADFDLGQQKWSGIVSIFSHVPRPLRQSLHRRVVDALAPGGVVLLEAYTIRQIGRGTGGPQVPELLMSEEELRNELSGVRVIYAGEMTRSVVEGTGHTGLASVVQFLGRKPQ